MYAIEFEATVRNGMIPIPQAYLAKLSSHLHVIVLQADNAETERLRTQDEFFDRVAQQRFDLPPDYRFQREALYDRR